MILLNIHEHGQYELTIIIHTIVLFHFPLHFLLHPVAAGLGRFQDFIVGGRNGLALE